MSTQVIVPMADILIKYCMLPYHAVSKSSLSPDGEIEELMEIEDGDD